MFACVTQETNGLKHVVVKSPDVQSENAQSEWFSYLFV